MMASQIGSAVGVMIVGVFVCALYYWLSDKLLQVIFPTPAGNIRVVSRNLHRRAVVRPWLFLAPSLLLLGIYLVYPVVATFILSFYAPSAIFYVCLSPSLCSFSAAFFFPLSPFLLFCSFFFFFFI